MLIALPIHVWTPVKLGILQWFSSPLRVLLPLLGIIGITGLFRSRSWARLVLKSASGLAIAYLILISPVGAFMAVNGLEHFLPTDDGQRADAIVILGRGDLAEKERSQIATRLLRSGRAPFIFTTGKDEAPKMLELLASNGIPSEFILGENCARTTEENAIFTSVILKSQSVHQIILVTDTPHMLRSLLTFRSFGFDVTPKSVPVPSTLTSMQVSILAIREYLGLLSYSILGRFQPRTAPELQSSNLASECLLNGGKILAEL